MLRIIRDERKLIKRNRKNKILKGCSIPRI